MQAQTGGLGVIQHQPKDDRQAENECNSPNGGVSECFLVQSKTRIVTCLKSLSKFGRESYSNQKGFVKCCGLHELRMVEST